MCLTGLHSAAKHIGLHILPPFLWSPPLILHSNRRRAPPIKRRTICKTPPVQENIILFPFSNLSSFFKIYFAMSPSVIIIIKEMGLRVRPDQLIENICLAGGKTLYRKHYEVHLFVNETQTNIIRTYFQSVIGSDHLFSLTNTKRLLLQRSETPAHLKTERATEEKTHLIKAKKVGTAVCMVRPSALIVVSSCFSVSRCFFYSANLN